MTEQARTLLKLDTTIPLWAVVAATFSAGITWAGWSLAQFSDLNNRLTVRETTALEYRKKVDDLVTIKTDVAVMKEILIRLERDRGGSAVAPR